MKKKIKNICSKIKSFFKATIIDPLQLITHPISGWEIFKQEKNITVKGSNILIDVDKNILSKV